jgi:hypothetical protein
MSKKQLGRSGIQVPALTFGGNVFGWTADQATSFSLLDALVDNQLNFIDTADVYSSWAPGNRGGESEPKRTHTSPYKVKPRGFVLNLEDRGLYPGRRVT